MSATRQRRSAKKSTKSSTKESSKQTKKKSESTSSKTMKEERKKSSSIIEDENPECGFETKGNKRRSKRLRGKKQKKDDSDYDSDQSNKSNKINKKRKRNDNENDVKSPPKKKARKTLKKKKNILGEWVSDPSFISDRNLLLRIGIAYTKQNKNKNKKHLPKLYYKSTKKYENKIYKWRNNRKYKLLKILNHKIEKDIGVVFKQFEHERMWYDSINYSPIRRMLQDETDNSNNSNNSNNAATPISENNEIVLPMNGNNEIKNSDDDDDDDDVDNNNNNTNNSEEEEEEFKDRPQVNFGQLLFKCKWEDWPDYSYETWNKIHKTDIFKQYCQDKEWNTEDELQACVMEHNDDEFKKIIENIRLYGNPTTRKALKMIINKELNVW